MSTTNHAVLPLWLTEGMSPPSDNGTQRNGNGIFVPPTSNNVNLASLLPMLKNDSHHGAVDQVTSIGGFDGTLMTPNSNLLSANASNNGLTGQGINKDVLNLYELLSRASRPQNPPPPQVPAPQHHWPSQLNDFGTDLHLGQHPFSYDSQSALSNSGVHTLGRGVGLGDAPPSLTDQFPDTMGLPRLFSPHQPDHHNLLANLQGQESHMPAPLPPLDFPVGLQEPATIRKYPLRALSAYNFFFRDERDRIVSETEGDYVTTTSKKRELLERHWFRDRTKKRRHRKTHGKIAFTELSKVISQRWKELPPDVKSFYHDVAAEDSLRYNREIDEQKTKI